ncbi:MAG: glycosyltransferase [Bacteroidaceae bacterium]|nr:glycosyltransferase [Bacteroidaceae bacterium]
MIFISFIIPHYNLPAPLVERCIRSIIGQKMTVESYEIIVVDDGSQQPPLWIEEKFPETHVKLIQAPHGGPGAARNRGIEEAQGRYLQFVDADDCLLHDTLAPCIELLHNEQPQILRIRYTVTHNNSPATVKPGPLKTGNTISGAQYMIQEHLSGSPCTYIFERDLATRHNVRFEPGVYHEDEEFNTKLHYYAKSLIDSNATVYNYCVRPDSITSNNNRQFEDKRINDLLALLERLTAFGNEHRETSNSIQRRGLAHKMTMLTVDTILNLMYDGRSAREIHHICTTRLQPLGLYPLPYAPYVFKYKIFRLFANHTAGLKILRLIIPRHKPPKK